MTEMHPDPTGDTGQKAAQYVQLVVMAAEAVAVIAAARARAAAERDEFKTAQITDQLAANHKAAAALWESALADHKLDVAQTLTAWSAAQAWRDTDPDADRASTLAEERLQDLRTAAMMRYEDLRFQGLDPVTAMRQVVPLLEADPLIGKSCRRSGALTTDAAATATGGAHGTGGADRYILAARRTAAGDRPDDLDDARSDRTAPIHLDRPNVAGGTEASAVLVADSLLLTEIERHSQQHEQDGNRAIGRPGTTNSVTGGRSETKVSVVDFAGRDTATSAAGSSSAEPRRDVQQALAASYPTALSAVTADARAASGTDPSAAQLRLPAHRTTTLR